MRSAHDYLDEIMSNLEDGIDEIMFNRELVSAVGAALTNPQIRRMKIAAANLRKCLDQLAQQIVTLEAERDGLLMQRDSLVEDVRRLANRLRRAPPGGVPMSLDLAHVRALYVVPPCPVCGAVRRRVDAGSMYFECSAAPWGSAEPYDHKDSGSHVIPHTDHHITDVVADLVAEVERLRALVGGAP